MTTKYKDETDAYLVTCDKPNCFLHVVSNTIDLATDLERNHQCPYSGGSTKYAWTVTMMIVERLWQKLDEEYASLIKMTAEYGLLSASEKDNQKGRLRGLAEATQMFMSPHFADANEIVREVMHRYEMKKIGQAYETPGIGSRIYEMARYSPSPDHIETQTKKASISEMNARAISRTRVAPKAKPVAVITGVDAETQAAIVGLGAFAEVEDIAQMYDISVDTVKAILSK